MCSSGAGLQQMVASITTIQGAMKGLSMRGQYILVLPGPIRQDVLLITSRHAIGDENVFLVNTTGWVSWEDVFPE